MEAAAHIAELLLLLIVMVLRRRDNRKVGAGLRSIAQGTGALVELVRSSMRPPSLRCGDCDHELGKHTTSLGEPIACNSKWCHCPRWAQPSAPPALAFVEGEDTDPTPVRRRTNRPEGGA